MAKYSSGEYYQSECSLRINPTKLKEVPAREVLVGGVLPREKRQQESLTKVFSRLVSFDRTLAKIQNLIGTHH
jgi:3-methyladenine DNA glycosylase/8-oxoguanine DNA glycosylase